VKIGRWPLLLALSCGLFVGLAPAGLLTDALGRQCAGQCRFAEIDGYWWRGSADIYLRAGSSNQAWNWLGHLRWQPEWLGWRFTMGGGNARLTAGVAGPRVDIDNIRLPAGSLLEHVGHGLPQDGWGGYLTARATHLDMPWNFSAASGQGEIIWSQARTSLLESYPLGDYRLTWNWPSAGRWQGHLSSNQEPMSVDGELALNPFHFIGQADLAPSAERLRKYLKLIGRPDGKYRYRISLPAPPDGP